MFEKTLKIIDADLLESIKKQQILLVGIGGVGGYALEGLVRLGFQNITLVDNDCIEESNLNRQIISNTKNLNEKKVDVAKERALSINPNCVIKVFNLFLNKENIEKIFYRKYDYILDACDTVTTKCLLIEKSIETHTKIISCMGTGNRIDPSKITITKLKKTYNDPLAKALRSILRKKSTSLDIPVVWSSEIPISIKEKTPGSIILVPSVAGIQMVFYLFNDLKNNI